MAGPGRLLVRGLRRAVMALGVGALFAVAVKLRASGTAPAATGGWRELSDDDLVSAPRGSA